MPGLFGTNPGGELCPTFAWDEVRDQDWFEEGAHWDLRLAALAQERKDSMERRAAMQKVKQSRRLKQLAKDELKDADVTDRRQKTRPRVWFERQLEGPENLCFNFDKAGALGTRCSARWQ